MDIKENDIPLFEHYFPYFSGTQQQTISLKLRKDLPKLNFQQDLKKDTSNKAFSKSLIAFKNNNYTPLKEYISAATNFTLGEYHRFYKHAEKTDFSQNELSFLLLILEKSKTKYNQPIIHKFFSSDPSVFKNFVNFTITNIKQKYLNYPQHCESTLHDLFLSWHYDDQISNTHLNTSPYFLYSLLSVLFHAKNEDINSIVININYMLSTDIPFFKKISKQYNIDFLQNGFSHFFSNFKNNEKMIKKMKTLHIFDEYDDWNDLLNKSETIFLNYYLDKELNINQTLTKIQKI